MSFEIQIICTLFEVICSSLHISLFTKIHYILICLMQAIKIQTRAALPQQNDASNRMDKKKKAHENLYPDGVREVFI